MRWKTKTVIRGNDRKISSRMRAVRINQIIPKRRRVLLTKQYAHSGVSLTAGTTSVYGTAITLLGETVLACNGAHYGHWSTFNPTSEIGNVQPNGRDTMFTLYNAGMLFGIRFHLNVLNCEQSTTFAIVAANSGETDGAGWTRDDFMPPYNKNSQSVRYRQTATIAPTDKIGAFQKTVLNGYIDLSHSLGKTRSILHSDSDWYETSAADSTNYDALTFNVLAMAAEPTETTAANLSYVLTITYDYLCFDAIPISID